MLKRLTVLIRGIPLNGFPSWYIFLCINLCLILQFKGFPFHWSAYLIWRHSKSAGLFWKDVTVTSCELSTSLTFAVNSSVLFVLRCAVIDNFTHHPTLGVKIEGILIPILLPSTLYFRGAIHQEGGGGGGQLKRYQCVFHLYKSIRILTESVT